MSRGWKIYWAVMVGLLAVASCVPHAEAGDMTLREAKSRIEGTDPDMRLATTAYVSGLVEGAYTSVILAMIKAGVQPGIAGQMVRASCGQYSPQEYFKFAQTIPNAMDLPVKAVIPAAVNGVCDRGQSKT